MTRRNRVTPTPKQAKALELIREGMLPTKAMKAAGYSEKVASHPGKNLIGSTGGQTLIEQQKAEYARVGITPSYMAAKMAQWLEAKKPIGAAIFVSNGGKTIKLAENEGAIEVEDWQAQQKAAQMLRQDWGLGQEQHNTFVAGGDLSLEFSVKHDESRNT